MKKLLFVALMLLVIVAAVSCTEEGAPLQGTVANNSTETVKDPDTTTGSDTIAVDPATTEPTATTEPLTTEPSTTEPGATTEPGTTEPVTTEPVTTEPPATVEPEVITPPLKAGDPGVSVYSGTPDTSWIDLNNIKSEYTITSADQFFGLMKIRQDNRNTNAAAVEFAGTTFKLDCDILVNEGTVADYVTAAKDYKKCVEIASTTYFKGTFDGQGHTISGIAMDCSTSGVKGIFGGVGDNATIKNLTFIHSYFDSDDHKDAKGAGGLLAARVNGTNVLFSNITIKHSVMRESTSNTAAEADNTFYGVGFLVGYIDKNKSLTIENCYVSGSIEFGTQGTKWFGGLVGYVLDNASLTVKNTTVSPYTTITGLNDLGGFVGNAVTTSGKESSITIYSDCSCAATLVPTAKDTTAVTGKYVANIPNFALTNKPAANATTLKVAEHMNDVFRSLGRTYIKDNQLKMDFACAGLHFVADCKGDVMVQIFVADDSQSKDSRFTIYVDGVRSDLRVRVTPTTSGQYFIIASDLPKGIHDFRIINQTQFIWSQSSIGEVSVVGEFQDKPENRKLLLEFYGDSILNGSNIMLTGGGVKATDATLAFGFQTAERLNADMNLIGCSSIGLTTNSRNFVMKDIWDGAGAQYTSGADKNGILRTDIPKYDFARIPNAVIIEQGVNDNNNASTQAFADAVAEMVNNLRSKYGKDVPIIFPVGYSCPNRPYNTALPTIIENLGGESANLYICELPLSAEVSANGGDNVHPSVATTAGMVDALSAYLKDLLKL